MILSKVMNSNPVAVCPDDSMEHAALIMAWTETHYLPVTMGDRRLVGVVSERDLLAYRLEQPHGDPRTTPLSEAMDSAPQTASPESSLAEVAARLAQDELACLPVTENGALVGFVTRSDVLAADACSWIRKRRRPLTAADVMTESPLTVGPSDSFLDAARLMQLADVRHLPVVDEDDLILGILSDRMVSAIVGDYLEMGPAADQELLDSRVSGAMFKHPMTVEATDSCWLIAELFVACRASAVLVASSEGTLEGIISYIDLLRCMSPDSHFELRH